MLSLFVLIIASIYGVTQECRVLDNNQSLTATPRALRAVPLLPSPSSVTPGIHSLATRHTLVIQEERIRVGQEMRSVLICSTKTALVNKMHDLFYSFLMLIRFYLQIYTH